MKEFLFVAKLCHEVNRAYCKALGDNSQPPWKDAPDWQKESAMKGVKYHFNNPDSTPADSHQYWLDQKYADGWAFGEKKDPEQKLHPYMVPFERLDPYQQAKNYIFHAIVHTFYHK